jgi:hypothetical protein
MASDNDSRLVNLVRAAYENWSQQLDVPTFTPPSATDAPLSPAGATLLARSSNKAELKRLLEPWLPGYVRRHGVADSQARGFMNYILEHLSEMGDRRFRDMLPLWFAAFTGRAIDLAQGTIDAVFTAAQAVDITLGESRPNEAGWTPVFRNHLRTRGLSSPDDLLVAPAPDDIKTVPALPFYRRELYRSALRRHHEGLRLFELAV